MRNDSLLSLDSYSCSQNLIAKSRLCQSLIISPRLQLKKKRNEMAHISGEMIYLGLGQIIINQKELKARQQREEIDSIYFNFVLVDGAKQEMMIRPLSNTQRTSET